MCATDSVGGGSRPPHHDLSHHYHSAAIFGLAQLLTIRAQQKYLIDQNFTGIVLAKEPRNESDGRIAVFTKELGLIRALAQSTQKPLSKLAAHLEPATLIRGRFIEKRQPRIVDAIQKRSFAHTKKNPYYYDQSLHMLWYIHARIGELQRDERLWGALYTSLIRIEDAARNGTQDCAPIVNAAYENLNRALGY